MIDYHYKFPDKQTMLEILESLEMTYINQETNEIHLCQATHQYAAHEVGEIPGIDGWHYNLRLIDTSFDLSKLETYKIEPKFPVCVWS